MVHHVARLDDPQEPIAPPALLGFDAAQDCTRILDKAKAAGVSWIGRYYSFNPRKNLSAPEAQAILGAGLDIVSIWEAQGDRATSFTYQNGRREALTALEQARDVGQPSCSAIYFAVDFDASISLIDESILPYFRAVNEVLDGHYRVGVYGSGLVCSRLDAEGLVKYDWLAGAMGWQGSHAYANAALTEIEQDTPSDPWGFGFEIDRNYARAGQDFGSWHGGAPVPPVHRDVIEEILSNVIFREGVRVYQRPRGLLADGVIGPKTLGAIGGDMRRYDAIRRMVSLG